MLESSSPKPQLQTTKSHTSNPIKVFRQMTDCLAADFRQNRIRVRDTGGGSNKNLKGLMIVSSFRLAQAGVQLSKIPVLGLIPKFLLVMPYRLLFEFLLGIEIPPSTDIGAGLVIFHGQGIVIHSKVRIGKNCMLRHGITIGTSLSKARTDGNPCVPSIGDNCSVGTGAILIGDIAIGDEVTIGAGTVVTKDVPATALVVGNPARFIMPS